MNNSLYTLVVGSKLWGTAYSKSDTEILKIETPTLEDVFFSKEQSIEETFGDETTIQHPILKVHNLIKRLNPDILCYIASYKNALHINEHYKEYVENVLQTLELVFDEIQFTFNAFAANNIRKLTDIDLQHTPKTLMNLARFINTARHISVHKAHWSTSFDLTKSLSFKDQSIIDELRTFRENDHIEFNTVGSILEQLARTELNKFKTLNAPSTDHDTITTLYEQLDNHYTKMMKKFVAPLIMNDI